MSNPRQILQKNRNLQGINPALTLLHINDNFPERGEGQSVGAHSKGGTEV